VGLSARVRRRLDARLTPERANFWCHAVEGSLWALGDSLGSLAEVVPVIVVAGLGASNTALGFVNAAAGLALVMPFFAAPRMEAAARKKRLVLWLGLMGRVPTVLVGAGLLLFGRSSPGVCLGVVTACVMAKSAVMTLSVPPWTDLLAETIPPGSTARLFAWRTGLSSAMGLAAGPLSGAIVAATAFPGNYALLYGVSFVVLMFSWLVFAMVDEAPAGVRHPPRRPPGGYYRSLLAALRSDRACRNYIIYRALSRARQVAFPFYIVAATQVHGMKPALAVGLFIALRRAAAMLAPVIAPPLADRLGHRRLAVAGMAVVAASAFLAGQVPAGAAGLFMVAVFCEAAAGSTAAVAQSALALSILPRGKRVGYMSLTLLALAPFSIAAPPAAGWVMDSVGPGALFSLTAALVAASILALRRCRREPGAEN